MKLIKKARLFLKEGKSDKVYEVDFCELANNNDARFLVNFRYGRRGSSLREGTKTSDPVTREKAQQLYDSVVVSKTNKGYRDLASAAVDNNHLNTNETSIEAVKVGPGGDEDNARIQALLTGLRKETDSNRRARVIWNLGSCVDKTVAQEITGFIGRGDWFEDYSIAWTLGRFGDSRFKSQLESLRQSKNETVQGIAYEALLLISGPAERQLLLQADYTQLPRSFRDAITSDEQTEILNTLHSALRDSQCDSNTLLTICYRLSLDNSKVSRALNDILKECPLVAGTFKAVRHIFKVSEMRLDAEVFGLLSYRFEVAPAQFRYDWDWAYIPGVGSIKPSKELKKPDSRLAYSHKTRDYMRRRSWRTLKYLGRSGNTDYVRLAQSLLLPIQDCDGGETRHSEQYRWENSGGRWNRELVSRKTYHSFANFIAFNHILNGNNPAYALSSAGRAWYSTGEAEVERGESFPELWDQQPNAALDLIKQSRCEKVHDFAIGVLKPQADFLRKMSSAEIIILLSSPYPQTVEFVLPLAKAQFTNGLADDALLIAMLDSQLDAARDFAFEALNAQTNALDNVALVAALLMIDWVELQSWLKQSLSLHEYSPSQQNQLLNTLLDRIFAASRAFHEKEIEILCEIVNQIAPAAVEDLSLPIIDRLLTAEDVALQLLGARLLVGNGIEFSEIPERLFQHIHSSSSETVRGVATALLGKQNDDQLTSQLGMLVDLYLQGDGAECRELLKLFARLAGNVAGAQNKILQHLVAALFQAERYGGQHDELHEFFTVSLAQAVSELDKNTVWRLLQARSVGAQNLGAEILQNRPIITFSVKQWSILSGHNSLLVRQSIFSAYDSHIDLVKSNTKDALGILENNWDDARDFGFEFFRKKYDENNWTPSTIISLCDSNRGDVQGFGRELLQQFFRERDGLKYLLALSQHPSVNVQLFVSSFLEDYAADHASRILALEPYFLTALSQIYKGRVCKDRIIAFLVEQSQKNNEVATMVAELFTRLSLTVVHKDKAAFIKAMVGLKKEFPQLPIPLKIRSQKTAVQSGVSHGI